MFTGSQERICAGKMLWEWDLSQLSYLPPPGIDENRHLAESNVTAAADADGITSMVSQTWSDVRYMNAVVYYWSLPGISYLAVCVLISLIAIVGNLTILYVNYKKKAKFYNNPMNAYNVSLAVAGLVVGAYCMWTHVVSNLALTPMALAHIICSLDGCIQGTVLIGSTLTLSLIAYHRFNMVCMADGSPSENGNRRGSTRKRNIKEVTLKLSLVWLFAAAVSLPLMLFRGLKFIKWKDYNQPVCADLWPRQVKTVSVMRENGSTEVSCLLENTAQMVYYLVLALTIYGIPFTFIVSSYALIARKVWFSDASQSFSTGAALKRREKRRNVAILRSMRAAVAFLLCWTPLVIIILYACWVNNAKKSLHDDDHTHILMSDWFTAIELTAYMLAYGSAALHPMLYGDLLSNRKKTAAQARELLRKLRTLILMAAAPTVPNKGTRNVDAGELLTVLV